MEATRYATQEENESKVPLRWRVEVPKQEETKSNVPLEWRVVLSPLLTTPQPEPSVLTRLQCTTQTPPVPTANLQIILKYTTTFEVNSATP